MKPVPYLRMAVRGVLCLGALAAGGCGANPRPNGKVVMNGAPYKAETGQILQITFIGEGASGVSTAAQVNPDGTFTVPGPTNTGIPAGKYSITVTTTASGGPGGSGPPAGLAPAAGGDQFQGKYSEPTKTPLSCEITSANPEIIIDVGKGTVSTGS